MARRPTVFISLAPTLTAVLAGLLLVVALVATILLGMILHRR